MERKKKPDWLAVDERCPCCNAVTKEVKGLTKQNVKKLLIPKWNMTEVIITILLIMLILLSVLYKTETQQCRDWISPMYANGGEDCYSICNAKCQLIVDNPIKQNTELTYNLTNISVSG